MKSWKRLTTAGILALSLLASSAASFAHDEFDEYDGKWSDAVISDPDAVPVITGTKNMKFLKEIAAVPWEGLNGETDRTADLYAHKGYVYVGTKAQSTKGVRVFDLKDPSNPVEVGAFADDISGTWQEKVIVKSVNTPYFKGDLAAVSVQKWKTTEAGDRGSVLYDVTDPLNPKQLGFWKLPESVKGTHELYLTQQGDRVLLLTANPNAAYSSHGDAQDFTIVDVTDPMNPQTIFEWDPNTIEPSYKDNNSTHFNR
jgi:hypothetical protein